MAALKPAELEIMSQALDAAWNSLTPVEKDMSFRTDMAQAVIDAAEYGERDPERLKEAALAFSGK